MMPEFNRRTAVATALATGVTAAAINNQAKAEEDTLTDDQKLVIEAGLSKDEAECWKKTAEAAGAFFRLPSLHPMDSQEVASAIHIIQNKLLSRPAYRKYRQLAEAAQKERDNR